MLDPDDLRALDRLIAHRREHEPIRIVLEVDKRLLCCELEQLDLGRAVADCSHSREQPALMSVEEREHLGLVITEQLLTTWARPKQYGENDRHALDRSR